MIEALLVGLTLMAISGVFFIAYNHPDFYHKILNWILFVVISSYLCLSVYNLTIKKSFYDLEKYIPKEKRNIAYNSFIENQILENSLTYIYLGIAFFFIFLMSLKILKDKK
jgi:hypothetical protein